ncbi:zinc finger CCCH domain-containing protein 53-like [Apium graveolens]|uniref:zinc finger CCCH domain-containing protein 53-like n=1 Tax=Apium graveolens TaxID=4045 RepID=UPI003D7A6A31
MDSYEATRVVYSRIQNLDPDNASKIMGLLLIQDHGEKEMIRLAFGPESLVHSIVDKARKDLGLSSSNTPTTPSTPSPVPFSRHNSSNSAASSRLLNGMSLPSPLSIPNPSSNSSWAAASNFSEDLVSPNTCLSHYNVNGSNLGMRSSSSSTMNSSAPPFYGNGKRDIDLIDEFELQDQLSFLNDGYYPDSASSPNGSGSDGGALFNSYGGAGAARSWNGGDTINGLSHRRSCSVSDVFAGSDDQAGGFGWKPCLYYARGYCKNGTSCRFLHEGTSDLDALVGSPSKLEMMEQCHELLRSKSAQQQRLALASQLLGGSNFPYSPKGMNLLLQQQNDSPRAAAAAAAAALMMSEEMKFSRSPRLERSEFAMNAMVNPVSRQIYLTFPADSTFREEDVSNYFSIFGPVQDVRIPYQQKRMFGFVTFVYPDTVKLILAKGNPHFVCDARVLVKPYKEKGKVPDKFRKQQHMDRLEFSACGSPTGLDLRDPYDLHVEARMLQNSQDILWRRKREEQADLYQAIELQNQRLLSLQLLDVKRSNHHRAFSTGAVISSPMHSPNFHNRGVMFSSPDRRSPEFVEENGSALSLANNAPPAVNLQKTANVNETEKCLSSSSDQNSADRSPHDDKEHDLLESLEHNLPDNLFSSPKAAREYMSAFSADTATVEENGNEAVVPSPAPTNNLMASSSTLDMASLKSCYFQAPRFASNHGAIEM